MRQYICTEQDQMQLVGVMETLTRLCESTESPIEREFFTETRTRLHLVELSCQALMGAA